MQSTRSASTRFLRISPSPDWFEDVEPLANTKACYHPRAPNDARYVVPRRSWRCRRQAIDPALVVAQQLASPVAVVEIRIGEDKVGFEVGVAVVVKRVAMRDLAIDAADRKVHLGEPSFPRSSPRHGSRSEEHTSELQSHVNLVCRLLLEKKKKITKHYYISKTKTIRK